jgi:hypothetical protein
MLAVGTDSRELVWCRVRCDVVSSDGVRTGDSWQNFVKYRLVLVREEESLGGRPHFWASINKPSLTVTQQPSASGGALAAGLRPQPVGTYTTHAHARNRGADALAATWCTGGAATRARARLFPFTVTAADGLSFHDTQPPEGRKL